MVGILYFIYSFIEVINAHLQTFAMKTKTQKVYVAIEGLLMSKSKGIQEVSSHHKIGQLMFFRDEVRFEFRNVAILV